MFSRSFEICQNGRQKSTENSAEEDGLFAVRHTSRFNYVLSDFFQFLRKRKIFSLETWSWQIDQKH